MWDGATTRTPDTVKTDECLSKDDRMDGGRRDWGVSNAVLAFAADEEERERVRWMLSATFDQIN